MELARSLQTTRVDVRCDKGSGSKVEKGRKDTLPIMPPSQRRRRPVEDDEADEDARPRQRPHQNDSDESAENDSGDEMENSSLSASQNAINQLAKKLVRYAVSCEYSRTPIRREGIKEKVLGNQGRSFRRVFELAQQQLRAVWGMELRELPMREKMSLQEKRQAMRTLKPGSRSQAKTGSGAFILTSTLPEPFRNAAILRPSNGPSEVEEATYVGFYTLVVALIWLNTGELTEQKLKRHLMRLNADQNVSDEKTEMTLKRMEKHGYVVKKVERPPMGQEGDNTITWHIGSRAKEEIGLDGVMGMVREVFGEWNADLEKKLRSSLGLQRVQNGEVTQASESGENTRRGAGTNGEDDDDR